MLNRPRWTSLTCCILFGTTSLLTVRLWSNTPVPHTSPAQSCSRSLISEGSALNEQISGPVVQACEDIIRNFPTRHKLLQSALFTLGELELNSNSPPSFSYWCIVFSHVTEVISDRLVKNGTLGRVFAVVKDHMDESRLCAAALALVWNASGSSGPTLLIYLLLRPLTSCLELVRDYMMREVGFPFLRSIADRHLETDRVINILIGGLWNLVLSVPFLRHFSETGGLQWIFSAAARFPRPEIRESILGVFNNMAYAYGPTSPQLQLLALTPFRSQPRGFRSVHRR